MDHNVVRGSRKSNVSENRRPNCFHVTLFIFLGDEPHLQNTIDGSIGPDRLLRDMTSNNQQKFQTFGI